MKRLSDINEILSFIKDRTKKRTWITFHSIGDRDCVGASLAIKSIFESAQISTPDFITNNSKSMLRRINLLKEIKTSIPKDPELIIILDANRFELLGSFENYVKNNKNCEVLFIDHHEFPSMPGYKNNNYVFNDEQYNSASSIVYEIVKRFGIQLEKEVAMALLNGIVADSANFQNADSTTFMQISELLKLCKMNYQKIIGIHQNIPSPTRKNVMEDLFNAKIDQAGEFIIIEGLALYHANLAAEAALNIGADAAVFWSIKNNEVSLSARLRSPLDKEYNLHLGKVMDNIGAMLEGTGGGHPCAAGAYGKKKSAINNAKEYVIKNIREALMQE